MVELAANIWADGPSSDPYEPDKAQIRAWGTWVEGIINAFTSTGGLIYSSKAALDADLSKPANSMAWVIGDPVAANNGVYGKVGASGVGSWTRRSDLPFSFIIASDAGAGTPNAIQATTSIPVSGSALIWMNVFGANTGSPVTVSFNGGTPLTIKTNTGNDVAAGGLIAGMIVLGIVDGSTFRLVSDQASAAIVAAAEAVLAEFRTIYLGAFAVAPTTDLEGNPLLVGAQYFNTVSETTFTWNGSAWVTNADLAVYVPPNLTASVQAPPIIKANGYRWSIFAFNGGEAERAKDTAVADYQAVLNTAAATREKIHLPRWEVPIRSFGSGNNGVNVSGPADVECDQETVIIAGDNFWNAASGNVFAFVGSSPLTEDSSGSFERFRWKGGKLSARQLTADHGAGAGFNASLMSIVGYFMPRVEGVSFDGGYLAPSFNLVGAGAMDTGLGVNQCIAPIVRDCDFNNFYDIAYYGIGYRIHSTLANNPITSGAAGSAGASVSAPAHGMRNGDRAYLKGVVPFDGLTFADGEYVVSGVTSDTFQVSATSGTATTGGVAGGGASIVFTNSRTNKPSASILGEDGVIENCRFSRNTNAIAIKRNMRGMRIVDCTFRENGNDIGTSGVGEYEGGDGKRLYIVGNRHFFTQNWPIRLQGGGPETIVTLNKIENFGRQIYDGGATPINLSSGFPISGIHVESMDSAEIFKNIIRMTDNFLGATWISGEEPAAVRLAKNADYSGGCIDCVVAENQIRGVPKYFHDESTSVRTRFRNNSLRDGGSVPSLIGGIGSVIEVDAEYSFTVDASTAGQKVISVPIDLMQAPPDQCCSLSIVHASSNSIRWDVLRVVGTSITAANVDVLVNVTTAAAGGLLRGSLKINRHKV